MKKRLEFPNVFIRKFEHKIILTLVAFLLIFLSNLSFSYSAESSPSIPDAIKKFAKNKKRMRIAVLDFANTSGERTRFDGYIADTIVSELSKYSLTLIERKRLKMLLKEHALSQSGVVDSQKAIEMGANAADIGLTVHPHPTLSETVAMAAEMYEGTITDLLAPKKRK